MVATSVKKKSQLAAALVATNEALCAKAVAARAVVLPATTSATRSARANVAVAARQVRSVRSQRAALGHGGRVPKRHAVPLPEAAVKVPEAALARSRRGRC